jgi:cytochrome o ubiquinol oxidase subunit 1
MQLIVSIRDRRSMPASADPWNGRTLEWSTASPPAPYNFARIPRVMGIDALAARKAKPNEPEAIESFEDIVMRKDSSDGIVLGAVVYFFAFAMVWAIWWLAVVTLIGIFAVMIRRSFRDDEFYVLSAADVARWEAQGATA